MNRVYIVFLTSMVSFFSLATSAQITHPDTACLNAAVDLSAAANNTYYSWQLNASALNTNINTLPAVNTVINAANASWTTIQRDQSGNWYGFYTYAGSGTVHKLSYGASPLNTPIDNIVGSYNTSGIIQGIDVVYDNTRHSWFGFVVGGANLVVLNFGSSLNNIPTSNIYNYPGKFSFPHQIGIKQFGSNWVGFIADRNGSIVRLDFPSDLTSQPIATNLPVNNYSSPCNFALYQSAGNWYMIVPSLLNDNNIALLNFGANIKNNAPASTLINGQISGISIPRSLNLFSNCSNNELYLYVTNEDGNFIKLNFNGQITNNAASTYLGGFPDGGGVMTNFVYDNTVYGLKVSSNGTIGRVAMFSLPSGNSTHYRDETLSATFTQTGEVPVWNIIDPGLVMGTSSNCDQMFVKECSATSIDDVAINTIMMEQNIPNPSGSLTTIRIHDEGNTKNKMIVLKDQLGRLIHTYDLANKNELVIDVTALGAGLYYYSLLVDGQMLATKKMVVATPAFRN